ncbi:MAG: hypothetical protein II399_04880 [Lachnospiraceae bacterium]|nr:hypothetical protein [Lachnospiraceae bacterium]
MFKTLRAHLADNRGDENISKMIWVAIVFVVGAILLVMVTGAFKGPIKNWYVKTIKEWFNNDTGAINNQNSTQTDPFGA